MINFLGCSAQGIAIANGVTTLALLERMVERKILTRADVRAILGSGIVSGFSHCFIVVSSSG